MTNQSNLQTQYPLSPSKFKKKMIEKAFIFFFLSALIGAFYVIIITSLPANNTIGQHLLSVILLPLLVFIVFMGIYGVYVHYYIKTYFYEDEHDFLTIRKGPVTPAEIHVQYAKIQDVYVDQDLLDRIFGIYDVHISSATYTSGIEAHIDGVSKEHADGLKRLLLQKIKGGSSDTQTVLTGDIPGQANEIHVSSGHPVSFSKPITSEAYGLGSNWWMGEFVKIAIASVFIPSFIVFWLTGKSKAGVNWNVEFWIWLGVLAVYVSYRLIYLLLWKKHYKYDFGPEYIYMRVGVIAISEKNMGYNTIQDVRITQGIVDRIFGVADLIIENAAAGMMPVNQRGREAVQNGIVIEGLSVTDARAVSEELKKVINNRKDNTKGL